MKQARIIIPIDKVEIVKELEEQIGCHFEISVYQETATLRAIIENNQTSTLLEELKGLGIGTVFGTIVISPVDIEITSFEKKLSEKGKGISLDEMISNVKGLALLSPTFVGLSVLAGFLAAFGLIYDNVIVVIASMIIAPLLGPIALTVIGTLMPSNIYSKKAFIAEIIGLAICLLIGFIVGIMLPFIPFVTAPTMDPTNLPNQIFIRIRPGLPDIIFAIASGLAAGVFIVRGESTSMVGVAVAASLCPPATNIGVLLAYGLGWQAFGSLVLLVLNVAAIYSACALIFWSSQTLGTGGSISFRQYRIISKKYITQIIFVFSVLIIIIALIIIYSLLSPN
ncbi:MAG: TIGR00341 family protein [Candidatus Hermodarchaeota archaeon]